MGENKINIDSFLDDKIKHSLFTKPSDDFIKKLERELELSREFAREDVKERKMMKYIIGVFLILFVSFATTLAYYYSQQFEDKISDFGGLINNFTLQINSLSLKFFEFLGLSVSGNSFVYVIVIMLLALLYTLGDRFLFRKSYKKTVN
jgi:hypothetical protein